MPNHEAVTVRKIICRFRTPIQLHTDQGKLRINTVPKMCDRLEIDKKHITTLPFLIFLLLNE